MKPIVRIKFGSHLYGTNTPASDTDYKAVHVPSRRDILLQRVKGSEPVGRRTKAEGEKNTAEDVDDESYALHRYFELLAKGETVAIDMLFAPEPELVTPAWRMIQRNSHRLVTKRSVAFVGYCRQQANKYGIKGSRVSSAKAAAEFFALATEARGCAAKVESVVEFIPLDDHTKLVNQTRPDGVVEYFIECCNRKVNYTATVKHAYDVFTKIHQNYGDRARKAEANEGVDWKALSHAVRVGQEALELLRTGHVTFPLANASDILLIKQGSRPYAEVAAQIEALLEEVESAAEVSTLPKEPDQGWIDGFVEMTYAEAVHNWLK